MFGWTRIATLAAVAAMLAMATGIAGATSKPGSVSGDGSHLTRAGKITGSAATRAALLKTANLRTRAGAARYLRSIGIKPNHLVIQRGIRNYAGANCPGKGWSCTSTAHPVIQIASAGGSNTFQCATASCAVVQATTAAPASPKPANKATCIKTTGPTQSCVISQASAAANNVAIVVETNNLSGLTQTALSTAQITQQATGASNANTACVLQNINVNGSTTAKKGAAVNVTLNAHQSVSISQDSVAGSNTIQAARLSDDCGAAGSALTQSQTLSSGATGSGPITQNENNVESNPASCLDSGPNVCLDIAQNSTSGVNTSAFTQTNTLTAIASTTPTGPVSQTQSSPNGGLLATVNQFSHGVSTSVATQTETQCEHAQTSGVVNTANCVTTAPQVNPLSQVQYGPLRKGAGPSTQGDNSGDTFTVTQSSTQKNDTGSNQTNTVQADCSTSGNCTVSQFTSVDGQTTTNNQSGQNVTTNITCTGTTCAKPLKPPFSIVGNNAAFGDGPIQTYDFNTGALVNSFVPDGATIDSNNGRAVLVVGNEVFYTELCCGGFGATDFIRVAPFNGGAGGADIRTLPNPSSSGVQDLAFAGGALYALTGYTGGPLQVFKLDPTNGTVLGGPVPITGSGQEASADGFAILPNGNFLINLSDASCTYNQYDPTTGTATGVTLTVPSATICTGVATDGTSLFFQTDFNSFTQTDLAGTFIAKTAVQSNTVEGISLVGS
jgi:hypothetical protein